MNHAIRDENLINIHITGLLSQFIYSGSSSVSISRILYSGIVLKSQADDRAFAASIKLVPKGWWRAMSKENERSHFYKCN